MQRQFQAPALSPVNKIVIIASVGLFILSTILEKTAGMSLLGLFGLSFNGLASGKIWQLVTYPFIERSFMGILFNCLIIWFTGSDLERTWGRKLYLQFLSICTLGSALVYLLVSGLILADTISMSFPIFGLSCFSYGLLGAYAIIYADREFSFMLLFPMKAKYFCMLLAGIELYRGFFSPYAKSAWGHLAGLAFGVSFLRIKSFMIAKNRQRQALKKQSHAKRANLHIVKGDDDEDGPKYFH